jgi:hypothetical protein
MFRRASGTPRFEPQFPVKSIQQRWREDSHREATMTFQGVLGSGRAIDTSLNSVFVIESTTSIIARISLVG